MKKKLILLAVGLVVLVAAFASLVYEKIKIVDDAVVHTLDAVEDSAKIETDTLRRPE